MQISKILPRKTANAIIALILMFAMTLSIAAYFPATVQGATFPVYAYVNFAPNPIGLGQTGICLFFLDRPSPIATAYFNPLTNWNSYMLTITAPDGTNTTFGPFTSDATGGNYQTYTPAKVGNYSVSFTFPGQTIAGNYYTPASATTTFEVTQETAPTYQTPPFPTNYWSFPIYGENRGWGSIAGNWLMTTYNSIGGQYNPYTTSPSTAHIDWTINQYMGGVAGENQINPDLADWNYYNAPTYQPYWVPPMVMEGRLYYLERQVPGNGFVGMYCVDLKTGKPIWFQPISVIGQAGAGGGGATPTIYGELFDAESQNGHGILPYFWNNAGNWTMFDANSGVPILTSYNIPTATNTPGISGPVYRYDEHGSLIAYFINGARHWLCEWNSTLMIMNYPGIGTSSIYTPPVGAVINWTTGMQFNVTIPVNYPGEVPSFGLGLPMSTQKIIFAHTGTITLDTLNDTVEAYDANTGAQLWYRVFNGTGTPPDPYIPGTTDYQFFGPTVENVICIFQEATHQWFGYDATSGAYIWGPTTFADLAWNEFQSGTAANGYLYSATYAGTVYCMNLHTGKIVWTYHLPPSGVNTPYGTYPCSGSPTVAGGKVYVITGEHTPNSPYWLGGAMYCINATTGDGIYSMSGWWTSPTVVADGQVLSVNCYDGTIYDFGQGQTATTVNAPMTDVSAGSNMVIQGMVTDQAPAAKNPTQVAMYPHGVPCVSDASMTPWMEYLYQQKTMPTNATGVPVSIDAVDPNNNFVHIATVTTDLSGAYSYVWNTPNIPGKYTIIATFQGSASYYSSSDETAVSVSLATAATSTPQAIQTSMADTYFLPAISIIAVLIIIVLALVILQMFRKRP